MGQEHYCFSLFLEGRSLSQFTTVMLPLILKASFRFQHFIVVEKLPFSIFSYEVNYLLPQECQRNKKDTKMKSTTVHVMNNFVGNIKCLFAFS